MEDEVDEGRVALEKEAKEMGWVPKDQFRGPEDQWRDADEFVERGRAILPIVKANNRKLMNELAATREELKGLKGQLTQAQQTQKDLLEHQAEEVKRQVNDRLKTLKEQKLEAIEDGDHKLAAKLEGEIDETKEQLAKADKAKPAAAAPPPPAALDVAPWAKEFAEENADWFGKDKVKTGLFGGICDQLVETTALRGAELLAEAKSQMDTLIAKPAARMAKSEPGGGGWEGTGAGGKGGAKGYASLPADAKAVCDRQESKFVGPGKAFKTQAEWRTHYANTVLGNN